MSAGTRRARLAMTRSLRCTRCLRCTPYSYTCETWYPVPSSGQSTLVPERRRHPPSELQDALLATKGGGAFLQQLVTTAATIIGDDTSATGTVVRDGHPAMVASSDLRAGRFDTIERGRRESPTLTPRRNGGPVLIDDLTTDERFSHLSIGALAIGLRSALFLPLDCGNDAVGTLSLYSGYPYAFLSAQQREVSRFAWEVSRALNLAMRLDHDLQITSQLRAALVSRTVIDQGIGIIMGQNRCNASTAFGILRTASQNRNVKLHLVSAEIITAVSRQPPTPGSAFVG